MEVRIGTSGYTYRHWWNGVFYPPDIPPRRWLEYYTQFFDTVELNVTFYRLPNPKVFYSWERRTPPGFVFAVKGSRVVTHLKKLKEVEKALDIFFTNMEILKEKAGVVLWQLPPSFKQSLSSLEEFLSLLEEKGYFKWRHSFEFRHPSWFTDSTYRLLEKFNVSLCIAHSRVWRYEEVITADFLYLRFHGGEVLYGSNYSEEELREWRDKIISWRENIKALYAYFNNDYEGFAVKNALRLKELLNLPG